MHRQYQFGRRILSSIMVLCLLLTVFTPATSSQVHAQSSDNPQSGSTGLSGIVPAEPPTQGATISFPTNGQSFNQVPIDVTGICPVGLLVKLFKNEVFAGSSTCEDGTFTITTDLFSGQNDLIARVFDELDQAGPDSNIVSVTFDDSNGQSEDDRVTLVTNFARRGANPGQTLIWPMAITGGTGPYAVSVDWGDGQEQLISLDFAGEFFPEHIYDTPGTYRVVVKATDANGTTAFLQLVAVANGAIAENPNRVDEDGNLTSGGGASVSGLDGAGNGLQFVIWPLYIMLFLIVTTFWLGRRYEIKKLKRKLASQQSLT